MVKNRNRNKIRRIGALIGIGVALLVCGGCRNNMDLQNEQAGETQEALPETEGKKLEDLTVDVGMLHLNPDGAEMVQVSVVGDKSAEYQLKYTSSDTKVCTVEQDGTVRAVGEGKATVTIEDTVSGKYVKVLVLVNNKVYSNPQETTQTTETVTDTDASTEEGQAGTEDKDSATGKNTSTGNSANASTGKNNTTTTTTTTATTTEATTAATTTEATTEATTESVAAGSYMDSYAEQVLTIVNQRRSEAGLSGLSMNYTLVSAAKVRAVETVQSFSHTRPNGTSCFTAFSDAGVSYTGAGENIAAGQSTPDSVMTAWMNSEGHKANILDENFTEIGIACYYDANSPYGYYWVQCFIY